MWWLIGGILLAGMFLLSYMYETALREDVHEVTFSFKAFPGNEPISLFFISDIHRRIVSEELVERVKGHVDFVLIGGDLAEKKVPLERIELNVNRLRKLGPVYFVWGNNDYEIDAHELDALFLQLGVNVLNDECVLFETNDGGEINLIGVDYDMNNRYRNRLDKAFLDAKPNSFRILASHTPIIEKDIRQSDQISLVLSGHTHGGQIRFFGVGRYKKGGIKRKNETVILTSNGYGTTLVPLRLGALPETHIIHLQKEG